MIEIKHRMFPGNVKKYRWTCSLCKTPGTWGAYDQAMVDGHVHLQDRHPKVLP